MKNTIKGRFISVIGGIGVGKSYLISEIINKKMNEGKQVLYLSYISPAIIEDENLTVFTIRSGDFDELVSNIRNNITKFDVFVIDYSTPENNIDIKVIDELKRLKEEFDIDIILSAHGKSKSTSDSSDNSKLYKLSDIVIYPNRGISTRIDLPKNDSFSISNLI